MRIKSDETMRQVFQHAARNENGRPEGLPLATRKRATPAARSIQKVAVLLDEHRQIKRMLAH